MLRAPASLWSLPAEPPVATPPSAYRVVLGSTLRMFWHSLEGVRTGPPATTDLNRIVRGWTDSVGGVEVPAPASSWYWLRPSFPANAFNGRPGISPLGSAQVRNSVVSSVLTSNFMMFALVNVFSYDSGLRLFVRLLDASDNTTAGFYTNNSPSRVGAYTDNGATQIDTPGNGLVNFLELVVADGQLRFALNGSQISAVAQGPISSSPPVSIRIDSVAVILAMVGIVSPAPTDAQRADILRIARNEWGF